MDLQDVPWTGIAGVLNAVVMPAVVAAVAWCRRVDKRLTHIEAALRITSEPMPLFPHPHFKRKSETPPESGG